MKPVITDGLTWADRVKGLTKPSQLGVKSSVSDSGALSQGMIHTTYDDDMEEGWETVTRFRSKSASSAYRTRKGSNKHKHNNKTRPSESNSNSHSTSSRSGSSSMEPSTPVLDEPVFASDQLPPTDSENPLPLVMAEPLENKSLATTKKDNLKEAKKKEVQKDEAKKDVMKEEEKKQEVKKQEVKKEEVKNKTEALAANDKVSYACMQCTYCIVVSVNNTGSYCSQSFSLEQYFQI